MPKIIAVVGPPCSGKSTIAEALSGKLGPHLELDKIREQVLPGSEHSPENRDIAYRVMHLLAESIAQLSDHIPILDATYGRVEQRRALATMCLHLEADLFLIQCKVQPPEAVRRFGGRKARHFATDLTAMRVEMLAEEYPYSSEGLLVSAETGVKDSLGEVLAYLNGRPVSVENWAVDRSEKAAGS